MTDYDSGYVKALQAAGFIIKDFAEFGTWQGDWFAFVQYNNEYGFIIDSYGSCSGCDAFQADCKDTPEGLKAFGEGYTDQIQTFDQALKYAKRHSEWDLESKQMVDFVEKHRYPIDFDAMLKDE